MPDDGRIYDGHVNIFGMDGDTDPSALSASVCTKSVNRIFRGGKNRTRPPFVHIPFVFENAEDEEVVRHGNLQGWMEYDKKREGREDGIVAAIGGTIFFFTFVNKTIHVRRVFTGNDPMLHHTWFVQAEEWVYIQNGLQNAIFWDGSFPSTARRSNPMELEMPIGTIMAYAHGRVWLSNAFNQIVASDIIYGDGLTSTIATQKFTEVTYWTSGGYFTQPTNLGVITGMIVLPRLNQSNTGQGELVVLSSKGASSFEPSIPRKEWVEKKVQVTALAGRGNVAHGSVIAVNNDCWFRSDDGIASYQSSISEQTRQPVFGKLSREVNNWLSTDTKWLIEHCRMLYYDNRVFCTTYPEVHSIDMSPYGSHIYNNGLVVLDLDPASGVSGDKAFNWDGLWTGIRPCGLIKFGKMAVAFSYDRDGTNRIYQIAAKGTDDVCEDFQKPIEWFYITKRFTWEQGQSNRFEVKKLVGAELWAADLIERSSLEAKYRQDYSVTWKQFQKEVYFGSKFTDDTFTKPLYVRIKFNTPEGGCEPGSEYPNNKGSQFQFMISGIGDFTIECFRAAIGANEPNAAVGTCKDTSETISVDGETENDYIYTLAQ